MTPMTREQLSWVEDQVHRAADQAARKTRNRALIGFLILLVGVAFAVADGRQQAARDARQNRELIATVQKERAAATFAACVDQNKRNAAFFTRLDRSFRKRFPGDLEAQRKAKARAAEGVAIILTLAPRRDCFALVNKNVTTTPSGDTGTEK